MGVLEGKFLSMVGTLALGHNGLEQRSLSIAVSPMQLRLEGMADGCGEALVRRRGPLNLKPDGSL